MHWVVPFLLSCPVTAPLYVFFFFFSSGPGPWGDLEKAENIITATECVLRLVRRWFGQGGKASLVADGDILARIIEKLRQRIEAREATFLFKKALLMP